MIEVLEEKPIKLFVYGYLRTAEKLHDSFRRSGADYFETATLNDYKLYVSPGDEVFILPSKGERVLGEIFKLNRTAMKFLDQICSNALYERINVVAFYNRHYGYGAPVTEPSGKIETVCWTHIWVGKMPAESRPLTSMYDLRKTVYDHHI